MLLSKNEMSLIYVNRVIDRFINEKEDKFKNTLSKLEIGDKIYKFKDFEYSYGYSESFGYYIIAINDLKEGFFWIMPPDFNENGLFFGTKEFKYLEREFYNVFNYTNFREIYINYIRTNNINDNISSFLSVVMFRSFPWLKRFTKRISSKIILVYIFNKIYNFSNETNELNNELIHFNEEQTDVFREKANVIKAATFTATNIDKILKKEISFVDILNTVY